MASGWLNRGVRSVLIGAFRRFSFRLSWPGLGLGILRFLQREIVFGGDARNGGVARKLPLDKAFGQV